MASGKETRPALDREGLARIAGETLKHFIDNPPEPKHVLEYAVRVSSGTTGSGLLVGIHRSSASLYRRAVTEQWYKGAGRILCFFPPIGMRLFTVVDGQKFTDEALYLSVDPSDLSPEYPGLIADFRPEKVLGVPSYILRAAPFMDNATRGRVASVNVFGEFLTEGIMRALHASFPAASVHSLYAVSELGALSTISCGKLPPNWYHPRPGVEVDVLYPDEVGTGELLASVSFGDATNISRYRTGDTARMHASPCACGQTTTFEILGRSGYDYLKIAGAMIRRDECDRVAGEMKKFDDYRLEAWTSLQDGRPVGHVKLRVFRKDGEGTEALLREIASDFARNLYVSASRTLADLIAAGEFAPLEAEFSRQPFPSGPKDVKLSERT